MPRRRSRSRGSERPSVASIRCCGDREVRAVQVLVVETTVCGQWRMGQQLHRVRHDRLVVLLAEPHRGPVAGPVQALSRSVHRDHGSEHANGNGQWTEHETDPLPCTHTGGGGGGGGGVERLRALDRVSRQIGRGVADHSNGRRTEAHDPVHRDVVRRGRGVVMRRIQSPCTALQRRSHT